MCLHMFAYRHILHRQKDCSKISCMLLEVEISILLSLFIITFALALTSAQQYAMHNGLIKF